MADFQYQPPQDDPLSKLRSAMTALDGQHRFSSSPPFPLQLVWAITVEGIRGFQFPQEMEDYATTDDASAMDVDIDPQLVGRAHPEAQHSTQRSNLRLFPPPIFSRQGIPQNYKCVPSIPSRPRAAMPHLYLPSVTRGAPFFFLFFLVSNRTRTPPLLLLWTRKRARRKRDSSIRADGRASGQRRSPFSRKRWVNPCCGKGHVRSLGP
jgi:hypothetical protein